MNMADGECHVKYSVCRWFRYFFNFFSQNFERLGFWNRDYRVGGRIRLSAIPLSHKWLLASHSHACLCHQAVQFSLTVVMLCVWDDGTSDVAVSKSSVPLDLW